MECPDVDELIRLFGGERDPRLAAHVHRCPACRSRAEVVDALLVTGPLEPVPQPLVDRVMAALPGPGDELAVGAGAPFLPGHRLLTFLLASLTALLASGLGEGGGEVETLLAWAAAVGLAAAIAEPRLLRLRESPR